MARPTYDHDTLAAYFYPLHHALFDDPIVGPTLRRLAVDDPDILAAVADVDRSQVRDFLDKTPWQRVEKGMGLFEWAQSFRRVP